MVREARIRDIPALGDFFRRAWKESGPGALGFIGANDQAIAEISSPDFLTKRLKSQSVRIFVAVDSGEVIGFASTRGIGEREVELSGIVVLERATGTGLGTRLLKKVETLAGKRQALKLIVKTESFNRRAIGFYEKGGFVPAKKTAEKVGRSIAPLVVLEKRLNGSR